MDLKQLGSNIISFINKLLKNKYCIILFSIFAIGFCIFWFYEKTQYNYYLDDEILDFIIGEQRFYHGRIISETLCVFLIKKIPDLLGININDFSFISKGILPTLTLTTISFLLSNILFNQKKKNILYPFCFFYLFFLIYFITITSSEQFCRNLAFFIAYIFPIIFFILFWTKIVTLYINEKKATKKDLALLILYTIFLTQANELMLFVCFFILLAICIEFFIQKYKFKNSCNYEWSFFSIIILIQVAILIHNLDGSLEMQSLYNQFNESLLSFENFLFYLKHCIIEIIGEHLIFLTIIILSLFVLSTTKKEPQIKKLTNIIFYTIGSLLLFFISLYFLGPSCHYANIFEDNIPSWWFLYCSLQVQWEYILLVIITLLFNLISSHQEKKEQLIILAILLIVITFNIFKNDTFHLNQKFYNINEQQKLYKLDKMALNAISRNENMVLPADYFPLFYTIQKDNDVMPYDIITGKYKNKIYFYNTDTKHKLPYIQYLEEVYDVNVKKGIIFTTEEKAINNYKEKGGRFKIKELREIDFTEMEEKITQN